MPRLTELTDDEEKLIQAYVFLPLLRRVLEHDKKVIELSKVKFKEPYVNLFDHMLNQVSKDLREVKAEIGRHRIKIIRHGDLNHEAVVRGWTHKIVYHPSIAAKWIEEKMGEYIKKAT